MITLYGMSSPNVHKIIIMLEELQLEYSFKFVDVWKGDQFSPELSRLNPCQKVPILTDCEEEREPTTIFESGAILLYLAEKHSSLLPASGRQRYAVLQWLMVQMASVGPNFGQFNHFRRYTENPIEYAESRFATCTQNLYGQIDGQLGRTRFLAGSEYSIADIAMFPWFRTLSIFFDGPDEFCRRSNSAYSNIWRWFEEILARPGVERALATIATMKSTISSATAEDRDRFFQRGAFAAPREGRNRS